MNMKKLYLLVASNTLVDLAFFASIPYVFLQFITQDNSLYLELACLAAVTRGLWYMLTLRSLEYVLKSQHEALSQRLFEGALSFASPHHRLNINAEITNYIYGRVYNSAMLLAEAAIILLYGVAITYFLGARLWRFVSVGNCNHASAVPVEEARTQFGFGTDKFRGAATSIR